MANLEHYFEQDSHKTFVDIETIERKGKRFYKTPVGIFPSVTTFLSATKSEEQKAILQKWRERVGDAEADKKIEKAKVAGTDIHTVIEYFLKNEPLPDMLPITRWMFKEIKPVLKKNITKVYAQEVALYSKKLGLSGRVDCVAVWNDSLTIVDFKTAAKERSKEMIEDYFLQCCAYAIMYGEMTGHYIKRFAIVMIEHTGMTVQIFEGNTADYVEPLIVRLKKFKEMLNEQQ